MNYRVFAALLAILLFAKINLASDQPNIVLILADDLGWADLSCYGNTFNETPAIDRLASEGMRFTQFYAGPVCSPTRANLQTGQDQARFGITQHIPGHRRPYAKLSDPAVPLQLPLEVETFAEQLQAAGYSTGYFGKWHLGGTGFGPAQQGWQTVVETHGNTIKLVANGERESRQTADYLTDLAIEFISGHKNKPFIVQVSHHAVHIPLTTTPELLAKYQAKSPMHDYPSRSEYAGLLDELDQSVGRIVKAIDAAGLAKNTIIVFLSDNGGLEHEQGGRVVTSNRPLRGEKGTLYEGGIRIPAIIRWQDKVPAASVCEMPATTIDIFPTFRELASVQQSSASDQALDGISLAGLLRDPQASLDRDTIYWHLPHYHHSTPAGAIRHGDWKLIEFFETGDCELYDLRNDVGEQHNLAALQPDRVQSMQGRLNHWRKQVAARMPAPNPMYDPLRAADLGKPNPRHRKGANKNSSP